MMTSYRQGRHAALVMAAIFGIALFGTAAPGQDAAWEGFIKAGQNALQDSDFSGAERHFEDALATAERFPSDDPRLGKSYNNLAAVYYAQEDHARAEPLMRRALDQLRESLGPDNTEVAQTMKNLAALYFLQGNRDEAESLLKQSLATMERIHGPNHAYVATVLSNLAGLYQADDRYGEAEPLLTRSLGIWERLLGPDHPDVERSRSLLNQIRQARADDPGQGQVKEAATDSDDDLDADSDSPRQLTALAAEAAGEGNDAAGADAANADANDEVVRATQALEQLTRQSKDDVGQVTVGGVPVPALNPIGAAVDAGGAQNGGDTSNSGETVTTALSPADARADKATAILNEAASVDDVSFAVYLSTLWSVDEARRYWKALQSAMPDVLGDKQMEIQEIASADGPDSFFRVLTTPFVSDPEAQAACEQIRTKLRTHDCAVVVRGRTSDG